MYGTRDAALNWAEEYTATLTQLGYKRGVANPCLYYNHKTKISILVHGDDFVAVGDNKNIYHLQAELAKVYKSKSEIVGTASGEVQEVRILNRVIRRDNTGYHIEADPRHAEQIIRDLKLEGAKSTRLPGSKELMKRVSREGLVAQEEVGNEEGEDIAAIADEAVDHSEMSPTDAKLYRAVTARFNYMSTDRPDLQYCIKEAARCMASPHVCDWQLLIKMGRYLLHRPRLVTTFKWQKMPSKISAFTDSDWAGCPATRKSTSGGAIMLGEHLLKSYSRQQKVIALSSAEAETYGVVACSAETLGIQACAKDLGIELDAGIYADASAALGIIMRRGVGKVRHIRTQSLWLQEAHASKRLTFEKVDGANNPADLYTKHLCEAILSRHITFFGAHGADGRAISAPGLDSLMHYLWGHEGKDRDTSVEVNMLQS